MTTSRFLFAVDRGHHPDQTVTSPHRWHRPARPRAGQYVADRAPTLIDGLIDRAHGTSPETSFILSLPSGEQVLVPPHTAEQPCVARHSGYFRRCVLPFCELGPSRRGGRCRMTPVGRQGHPVSAPFYEVDLRSGMLVMGAGPATFRTRPHPELIAQESACRHITATTNLPGGE